MSDFKTIFKELFIYQDNNKKYNFTLPADGVGADSMSARADTRSVFTSHT